MNYLSHYVFNHEICLVPRSPDFALGVALPDLWSRYSRRVRIQWRVVRSSVPRSAVQHDLQAGLLNHAEADRLFHALPLFVRWVRDVKQSGSGAEVHSAVLEFTAHVAIELALDHHLVVGRPGLVNEFYAALAASSLVDLEDSIAHVAGVTAPGLRGAVQAFLDRAYLHHYSGPAGVCRAIGGLLQLIRVDAPSEALIRRMVDNAIERVDLDSLWEALRELERTSGVA